MAKKNKKTGKKEANTQNLYQELVTKMRKPQMKEKEKKEKPKQKEKATAAPAHHQYRSRKSQVSKSSLRLLDGKCFP